MDIKINLENEKSLEIDKMKFQKMVFLYNALDNGWSIKKKQNSYIFKKNHEGKKEILNEKLANLKRSMKVINAIGLIPIN